MKVSVASKAAFEKLGLKLNRDGYPTIVPDTFTLAWLEFLKTETVKNLKDYALGSYYIPAAFVSMLSCLSGKPFAYDLLRSTRLFFPERKLPKQVQHYVCFKKVVTVLGFDNASIGAIVDPEICVYRFFKIKRVGFKNERCPPVEQMVFNSQNIATYGHNTIHKQVIKEKAVYFYGNSTPDKVYKLLKSKVKA